MPESLLRLEAVDFAYPDGATCFSGFNLAVSAGGFLLVRGPSGGGKSTLLRLLARFEVPDSGRIYYKGRPVDAYSPQEYRRKVCLVQQTPNLVSGTVRDNLLLPFSFDANSGLKMPNDVELGWWLDSMLLSSVSLGAAARTLSVGQRQRLCLVRTLLLGPDVLLMDEPTSALDPESRSIVEGAVEKLCEEQGTAVVWVSHNDFAPARVAYDVVTVGEERI